MKARLPTFVAVGVFGFGVQLCAIAVMTMAAGWPYEPATALAVEIAVVHNFLWHERWTWRDRTDSHGGVAWRFVRFQVSNGFTSLVGNMLLMAAFVEGLGLNPVAANVLCVVLISLANFLMADRWVFACGAAVMVATALIAVPAQASAAELKADTIEAWNRYVAGTEARWRYQQPDARTIPPTGMAIPVPGGTIHDWRGSIIVQGTTVEALTAALMNPGTPPPQEDLLESRVLGRSGNVLRVYLKITRRTLMTVTYDTEHLVTFERPSAAVALSKSVSTRISESDGRDRGFLWRLNSYWRYVQVGNDVRVEMQSVSLSRDVPALLKPVATPIVNRIARESMIKSLEAVRDYFERN